MLILLALLACTDSDDFDGDGVTLLGGDCDDYDASVFPGAVELCDGLDQDCDDVLDEGPISLPLTFHDVDGDGYGDVTHPLRGCPLADVNYTTQTGDCDDTDPEVNPGAEEQLYNQVDDDCDPRTTDDDLDGDGAPRSEDCDDTSAAVGPDMEEIPYNGVDDDCDPATPDDDLDGDGYDRDRDCFVSESAHADGDPLRNPGAQEIWYDGVDQNCDGLSDYDADGDGWASSAHPDHTGHAGEDCDDTDPDVYPGALEVCGNGQIDDCRLTAIEAAVQCDMYGVMGLEQAQSRLYCDEYADYFLEEGYAVGFAVSGAGDVDGDGLSDLLVGLAPEYAWESAALFHGGPLVGDEPIDGERDVWFTLERDGVGHAVAGVGDINEDGLDDFILGGWDEETSHLLLGTESGYSGSLTSTEATFTLPRRYFEGGNTVAGAGFINDDESLDILIGAPRGGDAQEGAAYLILGPPSGAHDLEPRGAYRGYYGNQSGDLAGWAVSSAGDVNGQGSDGFLVGAPGESTGGDGAGVVYFMQEDVDASPGWWPLEDASTAILRGSEDGAGLGHAVRGMGDLNGDGYDDIFVGAAGEHDLGEFASGFQKAYILYGPLSGELSVSSATADATFIAEASGDGVGYALGSPCDVNGDLVTDFLIGAPGEDSAGTDAGAAYLVLGPVSGVVDLVTADAKYVGATPSAQAGFSLDCVGDNSGDGVDDFLIGAPGDDTWIEDGGTATLITGGSY